MLDDITTFYLAEFTHKSLKSFRYRQLLQSCVVVSLSIVVLCNVKRQLKHAYKRSERFSDVQ